MSVFQHSKRLLTGVVGIIVALGIVARCVATSGELWLDEAWSAVNVSTLSSPIQILTTLHHDNNHLVNSLWLYLCGPAASPVLLRAPAVFFGAITLLLIYRYSRELFGAATGALWTILCSLSYPLVLYSAEARGYALMVACGLLCFMVLTRLTSTVSTPASSRRDALVFCCAGSVGCFAHGMFALVLAPAFAWLLLLLWRPSADRSGFPSRDWVRLAFGPIIVVGATLTLIFYSRLEIGGAPILPYLQVILSTIAVAFGGDELSASNPAVSTWMALLALAIVGIVVAELRLWRREGDPRAVLISFALLTPLAALILFSPPFILSRYFIFQVLLIYLVVARFLARLWAQGALGKLIACMMLANFCVWNGVRIAELTTNGRSHFLSMVDWIAQHPSDKPITLGADQVFQTKIRLDYARLRGAAPTISLIKEYRQATPAPLFVLREGVDRFEVLPDSFDTEAGVRYRVIRRHAAPLFSGAQAALYERQ